jgi:hypothetical protein
MRFGSPAFLRRLDKQLQSRPGTARDSTHFETSDECQSKLSYRLYTWQPYVSEDILLKLDTVLMRQEIAQDHRRVHLPTYGQAGFGQEVHPLVHSSYQGTTETVSQNDLAVLVTMY